MDARKLNILQVAPYFYPAWAYGGIPRVVYELSKELVKKGHEVTVYTTDVMDKNSRCDSSGKEAVVDGIRVFYFRNLSNALAYDYQIFLPSGLIGSAALAIKDFDIIHLHGHRNLMNNIICRFARNFKKPYIFSGHGTVLRIERMIAAKKIFDKFFGNTILKNAAHFIAVSESEVRQYKEMGISAGRVSVIYNGIDIAAFEALPPRNGFREKYGLMNRKIVLYLGKITPRKGIDFLVRAFAGLNMNDAVLVIAGNDMGFKNALERIIKDIGMKNKVMFTGILTGQEKLSAYRDADVLAYPAIHEIFGLVPFEAIMCGAPVIVTDDCGCGEIIKREDIGYTVKYNDVAGLRDKIGEVLADKESAMDKVTRGREFIAGNLDWGLIGDKYIGVYREFTA